MEEDEDGKDEGNNWQQQSRAAAPGTGREEDEQRLQAEPAPERLVIGRLVIERVGRFPQRADHIVAGFGGAGQICDWEPKAT